MSHRFLFLVTHVALLLVSFPAAAQRGWISGTVVDSLGVPLKYANVIVSDSWFGAMTDDKGAFKFELPVGRHVLKALAMGYVHSDRPVAVPRDETVSVHFILSRLVEDRLTPENVVVTQGHSGEFEEPEPIGTYHPRSKPVRLGALELTVSYVQSQDGDSVRTRIVAEARNMSDQPVTTCGCLSFWKVSYGIGPEVQDSIPIGGQYHYRGPVLKVGAAECTTSALECREESLLPGKSRTREIALSFRPADFENWTGEVDVWCMYFYGKPGSAWEDTKCVDVADQFPVPIRPIGMPYRRR
jgi:hypothetical protein